MVTFDSPAPVEVNHLESLWRENLLLHRGLGFDATVQDDKITVKGNINDIRLRWMEPATSDELEIARLSLSGLLIASDRDFRKLHNISSDTETRHHIFAKRGYTPTDGMMPQKVLKQLIDHLFKRVPESIHRGQKHVDGAVDADNEERPFQPADRLQELYMVHFGEPTELFVQENIRLPQGFLTLFLQGTLLYLQCRANNISVMPDDVLYRAASRTVHRTPRIVLDVDEPDARSFVRDTVSAAII